MKLFISHATEDKEIVKKIVDDFLYPIGLHEDQMFCSSIEEIGVPLKENIYDYIRTTFRTEELYVLFVISEAYYESIACLNEMGAAWVMQSDYVCVLLPGFEFEEIKGGIDPRRIAISLDSPSTPYKLSELKRDIEKKFNIDCPMSNERWERHRDSLLRSIMEFVTPHDDYVHFASCEAFCIGDQIHRGCKLIDVNSVDHRIITSVDFSKTMQDLCSTVVFPKKSNWKSYAKSGKSLTFKVRTKNVEPIQMTLELKGNDNGGHPRRQFFASAKETAYSFRLLDLADANMFVNVREICFLVYRDIGIQNVEIEISEIRIV